MLAGSVRSNQDEWRFDHAELSLAFWADAVTGLLHVQASGHGTLAALYV